MALNLAGKTGLQQLALEASSPQVDVLRLDLIHPVISGNKWFKLRKYLAEAKELGKSTLMTFGGAWSNHLLATAAAAREEGLHSIGLIRGEEPAIFSETLNQALSYDMQLIFLTREDYRLGKIPPELKKAENYIIPEGGYGLGGAEGAATILDEVDQEAYTHIIAAVGTGTMLAGLAGKAKTGQQVTGIPVLKNNKTLEKEIAALLPLEKRSAFGLIHDYHFGGYARQTPELIAFMNEWYRKHRIPTDFVYTGKMFFALNELLKEDFFKPGSRILAIHSGGLQGNRSLSKGTLIF